jgi:hypothetical protein
MTDSPNPSPERVELLLRASRRSLMIVLALILLFGATVIAHAIRPATLLANWPAVVPWLIPVGAALLVTLTARVRPRPAELAVVNDELRQANLRRAERVALIVILVAQFPLMALALSSLAAAAAVTVMGVTTVTLGMVTLIASFLFFDRE